MYADYIRERSNDIIIEDETGFIQFRFLNEKQVFIVELYVLPEFRRSGLGSKLADRVVAFAKIQGCVELLAAVWVESKNSKISILSCIGYGMLPYGTSGESLLFRKEI